MNTEQDQTQLTKDADRILLIMASDPRQTYMDVFIASKLPPDRWTSVLQFLRRCGLVYFMSGGAS